MSYKPLNESLEIRDSKIEGKGLFAKTDIPKNTNLGKSHIIIQVYTDNKLESDELIRTPLGGFYNHSKDPNCIKLWRGTKIHEKEGMRVLIARYDLVSLKDIKADEELTVTYTFYEL